MSELSEARGKSFWQDNILLLRLGAVTVVAGCLVYGDYLWGKADDCLPHEIDGQCGMSTVAGLFAGCLVGAAALVLGYMIVFRFEERMGGSHGM